MPTYVTNLLTATAASKAGSPTPTTSWQWLRNSTAIESATASSYTVLEIDIGQLITVRQTETNFMGTAPATSAAAESVLPFNPIALFAPSKQGVWYDPSDLTTMFQDRAGTTPVTTPGQTVGLRLDKSKGLTLGSELVDTANTASSWVANGTNTVTQDGDAVRINFVDTATGAYVYLTQSGGLNADLVAGKTYQMQVQLRINSGAANFSFYSTSLGNFIDTDAITSTTYVTRSYTFQYISGSPFIQFANLSAGESIWVRNISVKELAGNHAVAPTDAARPTYGIEPKTGRRNLLTRTEEFGDVAWTKALTVASGVLDPLGGSTAFTLTAPIVGAEAYQTFTGRTIGQANTAQCWMRRRTGSGGIQLYANSTRTTVTLTSSWQLITLTQNASATTIYFGIRVSEIGDAVDVWHPQFEINSSATAYQRVGTAFDVTEAGVPTVHYVQYDGSDDSFSTSSIDFSATDKMSVFAGVRKLSNATQGMFVELSASAAANTGAFNFQSPSSSLNDYNFANKGTTAQTVSAVASAPINNVLSGLGNISGDLATLRIDGTQVGQNTGDQGTGNYGNYPLYIGRRNNASLPFNGRDYGIIVVGKTASASEITATEIWLAAKTSGVTI